MKAVPINFVEDVLDFDRMKRDDRGSGFRKDLPPVQRIGRETTHQTSC